MRRTTGPLFPACAGSLVAAILTVALLVAALAALADRASAQTGGPDSAASHVDQLLRSATEPPAVPATLTLDRAIDLALRYNPSLISSAWHYRSAAHHARDESRPLNPTVDVTEENFGGNAGTEILESTVAASQTLELGGDRSARARLARGQERVAEMELTVREREVVTEVADSFLKAWWLEQRLRHLRRFEGVASSSIAAAAERTRIGAAPPVEGLRARGVLAEREIERRSVETELQSARRTLALQWGSSEARFDSLELSPPTVPALPAVDSLINDLNTHPDRLRAAAETLVEEARVRAARAARVPDVALTGGIRHLNERGENVFIAGVSTALPLWNSHGALLRSAQAEQMAASAREVAVRRALEQNLRSAYDSLQTAMESYEIARKELLPAAREALTQMERGYRAGRFTYLDQLETQRAALEAELTTLQTVRDAWSARFTLERLLGRTLEQAAEGRR